ncbi:MAG: hypothetical protein E7624_07800 [Ruminococcaceae bacterium]|nr:hypothetical protein [Oscillospiraceae bacterium]
MKKLLIILLCAIICILSTGCDMFKSDTDNVTENTYDNEKVTFVNKSNYYENQNKYAIVDSFSVDNEKYYYIFDLGTIDYVPLNISGAEGIYFDGKDLELEFNYSETNYEQSLSQITASIENSVSLTTTTYVEGSLSANLTPVVEAGITAGIEKSVSTALTTTLTDSYYHSVSKETTFQKNVKYKMSKEDAVGFYFYTPIASVKIYEIVVYNPQAEQIEYMTTYSQFGEALAGLYYSQFSFLEYSQSTIAFDESMMPQLKKPAKDVSRDVSIMLDGNGGECETKTLDLRMGEPYGELPALSKQGYTHIGWSCNGQIVDKNSLVLSGKNLVAKWELLTSKTISVNKNATVSSTSKLNPFGLLVPGMNGETSASDLNVIEYFDIATLKAEGYRMRVIIEYEVCHGFGALWGAKYQFHIQSGNQNIITISDNVHSTDYVSKKNTSGYIDLNKVTGSVDYTISTENVIDVNFKIKSITIEFVK